MVVFSNLSLLLYVVARELYTRFRISDGGMYWDLEQPAGYYADFVSLSKGPTLLKC